MPDQPLRSGLAPACRRAIHRLQLAGRAGQVVPVCLVAGQGERAAHSNRNERAYRVRRRTTLSRDSGSIQLRQVASYVRGNWRSRHGFGLPEAGRDNLPVVDRERRFRGETQLEDAHVIATILPILQRIMHEPQSVGFDAKPDFFGQLPAGCLPSILARFHTAPGEGPGLPVGLAHHQDPPAVPDRDQRSIMIGTPDAPPEAHGAKAHLEREPPSPIDHSRIRRCRSVAG